MNPLNTSCSKLTAFYSATPVYHCAVLLQRQHQGKGEWYSAVVHAYNAIQEHAVSCALLERCVTPLLYNCAPDRGAVFLVRGQEW
jgi:hypothetical protein